MDLTGVLFDAVMTPLERSSLRERRKRLMAAVSGATLEVGVGTGANLDYLPYSELDELVLLDRRFHASVYDHSFPEELSVSFVEGDVQHLPFAAATFDSVVFTLVFCSVADPALGLQEVLRVLKPGGRVFFVEHVLPEQALLRVPMQAITPGWKLVAGGCHLNRHTGATIRQAGFEISEFERFGRDTMIAGIAHKPAVA